MNSDSSGKIRLPLVPPSVRGILGVLLLMAALHGQMLLASAGRNPAGPATGAGGIAPFITAPADAGSNPDGALLSSTDGTFYGTTNFEDFNSGNFGSVFHMDSGGNVTALTVFDGYDGMSPHAALVFGTDGNLYGTTYYGANGYTDSAFTGYGTIFMIGANGANFNTLWSFTSGSDGANPAGSLVLGADGNFYGTTDYGGQNNYGVVFKLVPNGVSSQLTPLWTFSGAADGASPESLTLAGSGTFYGLTTNNGPGGFGTFFQLTTTGPQPTLTTLATFNGYNGSSPGSLIAGPGGNYYGVTGAGGPHGFGTIFTVTPAGQLTTLFAFDGANGAEPNCLILGSDGNFYGTTSVGGPANGGTFFTMTPAGNSPPCTASVPPPARFGPPARSSRDSTTPSMALTMGPEPRAAATSSTSR